MKLLNKIKLYLLVVHEVEAGLQGREGEHADGEGGQQLFMFLRDKSSSVLVPIRSARK